MQCRIRAQRKQSDDCVVGLYLGTCAFRGNLQTIELFLSAAWKIVFINMITHRNGMIARASFLNFSSSSQSRSTRTQFANQSHTHSDFSNGKSSRIHSKISYFRPRQQSKRNLKADNNVDAFFLAKAHVFRFFINLNSDTHLFIRMIKLRQIYTNTLC